MGAQAADCRFCQILSGERPSHTVLDGPDVGAFLDHRPLFPGHLLVVPTVHHQTLLDLPAPLVSQLFSAVQRLAAVVTTAMEAHGTFIALNNTVSQSVPHVHVHVVPRRFKDGLRGFLWPRQRYPSDAAAAEVAARLRAHLEASRG